MSVSYYANQALLRNQFQGAPRTDPEAPSILLRFHSFDPHITIGPAILIILLYAISFTIFAVLMFNKTAK